MSDAHDLATVLREHAPLLARIVGSHEADPMRRQELLQDISVALWAALPRWRGDASLRTFVARVAHNRATEHLAGRMRHREDALEDVHVDPAPGPACVAETQARRDALLEAVRALPIGRRQAVVLALEGFSQAEIAHALGVEENTVAQRLSRARRQLRDSLENR